MKVVVVENEIIKQNCAVSFATDCSRSLTVVEGLKITSRTVNQ